MRISFIHLAVGSLAVCLMSGSAFAQEPPAAGQTQSQPAAASSDATAPATAPASADAQPQTAAPAPAPVVTFENGQLTITGNNGTLSDILAAVQQKTGAVMESSAGMSTEKVIGQFGPGDPATVIAALLNGTSLNYVLVGSADAGQLAKVILTIRPAHVDVQTADEGGPRRRHRGFAEAAAIEAQELPADTAQVDPATMPNMPPARKHRRGGKGAAGDATDQTSADGSTNDANANANASANANANANANGDGTNPPDPNAQTAADGSTAIGAAVAGSVILPPDAPADIMKAIQHNNNSNDPATPASSGSARNRGFGPTPTSLSGSSLPPTSSGGALTPIGNGMSILGPAVQLPNGSIYFPGGASMPLKR